MFSFRAGFGSMLVEEVMIPNKLVGLGWHYIISFVCCDINNISKGLEF